MGLIPQLAIILVAVAVMSIVGVRLRISAIPLFILAGVLLGPSEPFPGWIEMSTPLFLLGEIGVILLLFYLGLEFSLERILQARRLVLTGGSVDLLINGGLGLGLGFLLFGVGPEAVLMAGIIYISSSGVITQALFDFRRLADDETDLVLGTLVFEDIAIALFLGVASGLAVGTAVSGPAITWRVLIVVAFVGAFLYASHKLPRVIDRLAVKIERERLVLAALALVIGSAALAEEAGLSAPVGALLAGIIVGGWDPVKGGQVYSIPLGGSLVRQKFAIGGASSCAPCCCSWRWRSAVADAARTVELAPLLATYRALVFGRPALLQALTLRCFLSFSCYHCFVCCWS